MTTSLPPAFEHFARPNAAKRSAQRVIHLEEIVLGFAAASTWAYALLTLVNG
jgi:hypothetical protein